MTLKVGDTAEITKTIREEDVRVFADLIGDHNCVHLDEEFARTTQFGRRIAHGMLSASLLSAVIGEQLPGPGTLYMSQTLQFRAPVYLDDTITARVTVTRVREDKPIVTLETVCTNQRGELIINGEAVVKAPK